MGALSGLVKIVGGIIISGTGTGQYDGPVQICPKCGMPHHGVCKNCAARRGTQLISEGVSDIKTADQGVYIEAQKQGYAKASAEYSSIFSRIESQYCEARKIFENERETQDEKSEALIKKYEDLLKDRKRLQSLIKSKAKEVARKSGASTTAINQALATGNAFVSTPQIDILGLIHSYREKKIREAERMGYIEAKDLYERKIAALQLEFNALKVKSAGEINRLCALIADVLSAISDEEMKIAALRIMLYEG